MSKTILNKLEKNEINTCASFFKNHTTVMNTVVLSSNLIKISWKWAKKGDFENPKVQNCNFSTKSVFD